MADTKGVPRETTPGSIDIDLFAMMGMKKFSIMDADDAKMADVKMDEEQPVSVEFKPAADGQSVSVTISVRHAVQVS